MNKNISKKLAKRKKKISKILNKRDWDEQPAPMFKASNIQYEIDGRLQGIAPGGIGLIHMLAKKTGLLKEIDKDLELLKRHLPYHESDHVANMAYNILAGGTCLQDIELLRNNEAWLNALGAEVIPDPTTAGDFLRRFSIEDIITLLDIKNTIRKKVWEKQPENFKKEAIINIDGTISETTGECKQGIDISYNGKWGYAPLVVSLEKTREPLYIINRSGMLRPTLALRNGWIKPLICWMVLLKNYTSGVILISALPPILTNGINAVPLSSAWMPDLT